jgi:hypothetical protein
MLFQEVREEKHLQHNENNEEFYKDNSPQRASQLHVAEPFVIEFEDLVKQVVALHVRSMTDVNPANIRIFF